MEADLDILSSQLKQGLDLKVDNGIDSKNYQKQTLLNCGYRLGDKIGAGAFSLVYKAYDRQDMPVAIKITNKRQHRENALKGVPESQTQQVIEYYNQMIQNELQLMMTIDSENVLKMINFFDDDQNWYYITEYCDEEVSQYCVRVTNNQGFDEQTAVKWFIQILNGMKDINDAQFVHRDLKPQNILKQGNILKIADFGFSKPISGQQFFTTQLGTPEYMAPEIIQGLEYNHKVDIWSLGVILFIMIFMVTPFCAPGNILYKQKLYCESNNFDVEKVLEKKKDFQKAKARTLSKEMKDLFRRIFVLDPKERIDYPELLTHPALTNNLNQSGNLQLQKMSKIKPSIISFDPKGILKPQSVQEMVETKFENPKISIIKSNVQEEQKNDNYLRQQVDNIQIPQVQIESDYLEEMLNKNMLSTQQVSQNLYGQNFKPSVFVNSTNNILPTQKNNNNNNQYFNNNNQQSSVCAFRNPYRADQNFLESNIQNTSIQQQQQQQSYITNINNQNNNNSIAIPQNNINIQEIDFLKQSQMKEYQTQQNNDQISNVGYRIQPQQQQKQPSIISNVFQFNTQKMQNINFLDNNDQESQLDVRRKLANDNNEGLQSNINYMLHSMVQHNNPNNNKQNNNNNQQMTLEQFRSIYILYEAEIKKINYLQDIIQIIRQEDIFHHRLLLQYQILKCQIFLLQQLQSQMQNKKNIFEHEQFEIFQTSNLYQALIAKVTNLLNKSRALYNQAYIQAQEELESEQLKKYKLITQKNIINSVTEEIKEQDFKEFKYYYRPVLNYEYKQIYNNEKLGVKGARIAFKLMTVMLINRIFEFVPLERNDYNDIKNNFKYLYRHFQDNIADCQDFWNKMDLWLQEGVADEQNLMKSIHQIEKIFFGGQ